MAATTLKSFPGGIAIKQDIPTCRAILQAGWDFGCFIKNKRYKKLPFIVKFVSLVFADNDAKKFNKFILCKIFFKIYPKNLNKYSNLFFDTTISAKVKMIFAAAAA